MKKEINARETSRAAAFELWISADADGNPDQDIRCFPNYEDKQEEGVEIQYDLVLGDRLCCIENQGVLSSSGKRIF